MEFSELASLSVEQKIGQLFFIGIAGPELDEPTLKLLSDISPGGVCLFARNVKEATQTRNLLDGVRGVLQIEPFLSLDQEGGLVDRLRRVLTPMPAANKIRNAEEAKHFGEIIGESIRLLGFNMDFAPVIDVMNDVRARFTNGLHSRAFGGSKEDVVDFGGAFLDGLESKGILGCLKHFPGLAAAEVDSHEDLPAVMIAENELQETDLYPYRQLLNSNSNACVMIAHASYPNTRLQERDVNGKLLPSSLNYTIVSGLLRDELKFPGVAVTDDLEMGAILKNYGIGEACKMAIHAGQDMLAICANPESIYKGFAAIRSAVERGEISEARIDESLERIAGLKSKISPRVPLDTDRLSELSAQIKELNENLN
jgi:beta-N-acetylhexosaminidase